LLRLTLRQLDSRQSHVGRQRLGCWRRQQLWRKLQGCDAGEENGGSFGRKLPANA
jgi:hypothetical protein